MVNQKECIYGWSYGNIIYLLLICLVIALGIMAYFSYSQNAIDEAQLICMNSAIHSNFTITVEDAARICVR